MTAPTLADAARRRPVRLPDGRTARLVFLPGTRRHRAKGAKARIVLPSGRYLSIDPTELDVLEESAA